MSSKTVADLPGMQIEAKNLVAKIVFRRSLFIYIPLEPDYDQ